MTSWIRCFATLVVCGASLLPWPCFAQAQASAPVAILEALQKAAGGDRWAAVKSLHYVMTSASGGQRARLERWEDVATGRFADQTIWPTYQSGNGFDGVTAWHEGRSGIAYSLGDIDAALVAADEAFRVSRSYWFRDRHPATIAPAGERSEQGRRFDILEITPEGGRPFQVWIDRSTHLLARTVEQQAEDLVVTSYSDYRPVSGVMIPFVVRSGDGTDPRFDEVKTIETVEVNPDIPDARYAIPPRPPSDIALPPQKDSVEVPFRLTADNRIMVPVEINGRRTVDAEFDSGGSLILQPPVVAGMGLITQGQSRQGGGGEGATAATNGRVATVGLGEASVHDVAFHSFAFAPNEPDKAIIGLEILQRFVVRLDFDRQVMTLTRPEAFTYHGTGTIIPFHIQ